MRSLLSVICVLFLTICQAQINEIQFEKHVGLVKSKTFNEIIKEDFNYLIFNNFTPEQGASFTAKETDTKFQVSLKVSESKYGIFTASLVANASNGIYFFDEDQGQSAQINANYFKFFRPKYKFYRPNNIDLDAFNKEIYDSLSIPKAKLDFIKNEIEKEQKSKNDTTLHKEYLNDTDEILKTIESLSESYINKCKSLGFDKLVAIKPMKINLKGKNGNLNALLIASELKAIEKSTKTIEKSLIDLEKKLASKAWTTKRLYFISGHGTYQRESFNRFTAVPDATFAQQFTLQTGDIYSARIYGGFFQHRLKPVKRKWIPTIIVLRPYLAAGRISNRLAFAETTINSNEIITDNGNNQVATNQSRTAYIGQDSYEYGNSFEMGIEAYLFPKNYNFGFFAQIGQKWNHFSRLKNVDNLELTPFRAGILIGFKKKEKKKPAVTAQLFIDRTDLSLAPNGNDSDLRVGFGLGIPFKI